MERVWKGKRRRERSGQKNESFSKNKNEKPAKEVEKDRGNNRGNEFHSLFVSMGAKKGNPLIEVQERIRLALSATYFLHVVILSSLPQEVYSAAHGFGQRGGSHFSPFEKTTRGDDGHSSSNRKRVLFDRVEIDLQFPSTFIFFLSIKLYESSPSLQKIREKYPFFIAQTSFTRILKLAATT